MFQGTTEIFIKIHLWESKAKASLVVQWLRICLPTQGTPVQSLVWKDPPCHGATKSVCRNFRACTLQPTSCNCRVHVLQLLKPKLPGAHSLQQEKPPWTEAVHRNSERPRHSHADPVQPEIHGKKKKESKARKHVTAVWLESARKWFAPVFCDVPYLVFKYIHNIYQTQWWEF